VSSHQSGKSLKQQVIKAASHQSRKSSRRQVIKAASHQGSKSLRWQVIKAGSHQTYMFLHNPSKMKTCRFDELPSCKDGNLIDKYNII
jgi:hypothetical protein